VALRLPACPARVKLMADISDTLTQELGPLPVWAWGVAIVGGLGVGWYIQQRRAADMAAAGEESQQQTEQQAAAEAEQSGLPATQGALALPGGGGAGAGMAPVLPEEQTGGELSDNPAWRSAGVEHLAGEGVSGTAADRALGRYLAGQRLTQDQANLVDRAITVLGTPPSPVPAPQIGPEPTPEDPPASGPDPDPEPPPPDPAPSQSPAPPPTTPEPPPPAPPEPAPPDPDPAPWAQPAPPPSEPAPDPQPSTSFTETITIGSGDSSGGGSNSGETDPPMPAPDPEPSTSFTETITIGSGDSGGSDEPTKLNVVTGENVPVSEVPPESEWSLPGQYA